MKKGKADVIDAITAEILQADLSTSTNTLTELFKEVCSNESIPRDWTRDLIVKIPKKDHLSVCDRGITLFSTPSKVICRILLNRMTAETNGILREEQAGFRRGRPDICTASDLAFNSEKRAGTNME